MAGREGAGAGAASSKKDSKAVLERLTALHPKLIDLSLGRMRRLLEAVGQPQRSLPPVIHVAGTNGKGSVIALLRACLEAAGNRVHVYVSPHLVAFNERIVLAGKVVDDETLTALLMECETANASAPITFFEITTAAAFLAFARHAADVLLLETGLGGRLDATNVVPGPALTAITPVFIDHEHFLGTTYAEIAAEKAGILKPSVAAVIGPQTAEAMAVIAARAEAEGCALVQFGRDFEVRPTADGMEFLYGGESLVLPRPALAGDHQLENAAVALACLRALPGISVAPNHLAEGLRRVDWPGRLQRLRCGPLVEILPPESELWLDAGHNPAAGAALAAFARAWRERPLHLVVGMIESKDATGFLRPFAGLAQGAVCVPVPGSPAGIDPGRLQAAASAAGLAATTAADVARALTAIAAPGRILICGSAYLAGDVLARNG